jgi:hypothetical protein
MSDMPTKIAAWRFIPEKADEWLHGGWSEDHDHKTTSYISEDYFNAHVAVLTAQIYRLTAAGDNLTAWVDERGTPDVRKWDKARDEAFKASTLAKSAPMMRALASNPVPREQSDG